MNENRSIRRGFNGCFISLTGVLLAVISVSISANHGYPRTPACEGTLGGGFPMLFICDDPGGGSPTGSWGKIDFVDVLNGGLVPGGFLVDFLFYFFLIWLIWFVTSGILRKGRHRSDLWLTTFISLGFIMGFLLAFLIFLPDYYERAGPPLIRTPTPAYTPPPEVETANPSILPTP